AAQAGSASLRLALVDLEQSSAPSPRGQSLPKVCLVTSTSRVPAFSSKRSTEYVVSRSSSSVRDRSVARLRATSAPPLSDGGPGSVYVGVLSDAARPMARPKSA